jgi:hypothetical protein
MMKILIALLLGFLSFGCSTPGAPDAKPREIQVKEAQPAYQKKVQHPHRLTTEAIRALFNDAAAPDKKTLEKCDFDYQVERMLARNPEDTITTLTEHVRDDPEHYHWCFYAKVLSLEIELAQREFLDEKQNTVLKRYMILVHIARAFKSAFDDSKYLEFAVANYKRLNLLYFGRELSGFSQ